MSKLGKCSLYMASAIGATRLTLFDSIYRVGHIILLRYRQSVLHERDQCWKGSMPYT